MLATTGAMFSVLLIATGIAKIARPADVARAIDALGAPRIPAVGIVIGVAEVAIGGAALGFGAAMWVQGALYAVFASWVVAALRADVPIASCGCLGRSDTPPTVAHILLNSLGALVSLGAAVSGEPLAVGVALAGFAQVVVVGSGVFLAYVILGDASYLVGARRK